MSMENGASSPPAGEEELGRFYGNMNDLVVLCGISDYTRANQFVNTPRDSFLESAQGEEIELRFCRNNTLQVSIHDSTQQEVGYYLLYVDETATVTAEMHDPEVDITAGYALIPVTSAALSSLELKIAGSHKPFNSPDSERTARQIGLDHKQFSRKATVRELARLLDLSDAIVAAQTSEDFLDRIVEYEALMRDVVQRPELLARPD